MPTLKGRTTTPSEQRPNFTGKIDALSAGNDPTIRNVTFTSSASGHRKSLVTILADGDVVWIDGGEVHWQGAAADSLLTDLACAFGTTNSMHEVLDEHYNRGLLRPRTGISGQ